MTMDWKSKTSVGPFRFGESISMYISAFNLECVEDPTDCTGWNSFNYNDDELQIHCEGNLIVSIACYRSFVVDGKEIIGLPLREAKLLLCSEPDEFGDPLIISDEWQIPVEFYDFSIQVWVSEQHPHTVNAVIATG